MNSGRRPKPWIIIVIAFLLVAAVLILGRWSFNAALGKFNERQLGLAQEVTSDLALYFLFLVGLSVLVILAGTAYLLVVSFRARKDLEREVAIKTAELRATNQRLSEALDAVEEAHAFQQSIIDGMAVPLVVIGPGYQIKLMNKAARELASGGSGPAQPAFCYQVLHRHQAPCSSLGHACPMEQVYESGQPATVIHEHYGPGGEKRSVKVLVAPIRGTDGSFQGLVELSYDTRAPEMADALSLRQAELAVPRDDLDEFSAHVARSLHDFFARLPSE